MSYAHILGSMYEHSSCMIIFLSCMINVYHGLYHDPYPKGALGSQKHVEEVLEVSEEI